MFTTIAVASIKPRPAVLHVPCAGISASSRVRPVMHVVGRQAQQPLVFGWLDVDVGQGVDEFDHGATC